MQEALNRSAAQVIAAAEDWRQTGTAAAGVAAGQRGVGAIQSGCSSTSVPPAARSKHDGPLPGIPYAPGGYVDSAGIARAKHAAMAYHLGRSGRLGGVHQEGSLQPQQPQYNQQQLLMQQQQYGIQQRHNQQQQQQHGEHTQAPRPLAGHKRQLETRPHQELLQHQQQQHQHQHQHHHKQQQRHAEDGRQVQLCFEQLTADLIIKVRDGTVPAAAAAAMLRHVQQQQIAQQNAAGTAAAAGGETGERRVPAGLQAADSGTTFVTGAFDQTPAALANQQQQPAPSVPEPHLAAERELQRLRQQTQDLLSLQPLLQTQHLQQAQQQQQQVLPQADLWGLPGGVDELDDPAGIMQQINGLEEAVRNLTGRTASPAAASLQQQQHVEPGQPQKRARLEVPEATPPAAGVASRWQSNVAICSQHAARPQPMASQERVIASQPAAGAAAAAQGHTHASPDQPRESRLQTIKQRLQQMPDRAKVVQQIKAEATVDLGAFLLGTEASPDRVRSLTPVHPALAQAAKQNDMALLTEAAEAILDGREPRVRAATVSRYGGTTRVTSAADLVSMPLGQQVLSALQKLLLVPGSRGKLPPGAQIIVEVAMPQSAGATPAAAAASSDSLFAVSAVAAVTSGGAVGAAAPEQVSQGAAQQETLHIDLTEADADDDMQAETAGVARAHAPSRSATPAAADSATYVAAGATGRILGVGTLADAAPAIPTAPAVEGVSQGKAHAGAAAGAMVADAYAELSARPATLPNASNEAENSAVGPGGKRSREQEQLNELQATCPLAPPAKRIYRAELYL